MDETVFGNLSEFISTSNQAESTPKKPKYLKQIRSTLALVDVVYDTDDELIDAIQKQDKLKHMLNAAGLENAENTNSVVRSQIEYFAEKLERARSRNALIFYFCMIIKRLWQSSELGTNIDWSTMTEQICHQKVTDEIACNRLKLKITSENTIINDSTIIPHEINYTEISEENKIAIPDTTAIQYLASRPTVQISVPGVKLNAFDLGDKYKSFYEYKNKIERLYNLQAEVAELENSILT